MADKVTEKQQRGLAVPNLDSANQPKSDVTAETQEEKALYQSTPGTWSLGL